MAPLPLSETKVNGRSGLAAEGTSGFFYSDLRLFAGLATAALIA
jgi:hypothetical protein